MFIADSKAYREGYQASERTNSQPSLAKNPYLEHSLSWESWNQGWNGYFNKNWRFDSKINP